VREASLPARLILLSRDAVQRPNAIGRISDPVNGIVYVFGLVAPVFEIPSDHGFPALALSRASNAASGKCVAVNTSCQCGS